MNEPLLLRVPNSFDAIPPASEAISQWLDNREVPPAACYLANPAIEELITNTIKYGYDDAAVHEIEIRLSLNEEHLVLTVIDDGHAFNPLEAPEPETTLPIEDRPVGGLGIFLLRKLADRMTYERKDGCNQVTIVKRTAGA
jgi:anti-sigma regulatory factor (Ser/Thr protein kinase)